MKNKLYSPAQIANFFIEKSLHDKDQSGLFTPMKLQKLVYFAHGWNLGIHKQPLINEAVQAWDYGPVILTLYDQTKHYGNNKITKPISAPSVTLDQETEKLLNVVWDSYKKFTGIQLSNLTHELGTPWRNKYDEEFKNFGQLRRYIDIPDADIEEFFAKKVEPNDFSRSA